MFRVDGWFGGVWQFWLDVVGVVVLSFGFWILVFGLSGVVMAVYVRGGLRGG